MTCLRPLRRRLAQDRGSVSVWLIGVGAVLIVVVGIAVDLSGQIRAQQHAHSVATQAARVGGQQLQGAAAVQGDLTAVDLARGVAAAEAYLAGSDVGGSVSVTDGSVITVTTTDVYATQYLGIVGIGDLTVTGNAEARAARALAGVEQ